MEGVILGLVHGNQFEADMVRSLMDLQAARPKEVLGRVWQTGEVGRLDIARNAVASTFLGMEADWLLWIDSDMAFTLDDYDLLYAKARAGEPVMSGLYFANTDPPLPVMRQFSEVDGEMRNCFVEDWPKGEVIYPSSVGFGFIFTHREVFEAIKPEDEVPWFGSAVGPHGQRLSEDQSFCLRARDAGFRIAVDTGTVIGHIKPHIIRGPA